MKQSNYLMPRGDIQRQVQRLYEVDELLFKDASRDDFVIVTDEENVACYVKGRVGDTASMIPITTNINNYDLWIVHTGKDGFDNKSLMRKWIKNTKNWNAMLGNEI